MERQLYQDLRDVDPATFQHLQWTRLRRSDRPAPTGAAEMVTPGDAADLADDEPVIGLRHPGASIWWYWGPTRSSIRPR